MFSQQCKVHTPERYKAELFSKYQDLFCLVKRVQKESKIFLSGIKIYFKILCQNTTPNKTREKKHKDFEKWGGVKFWYLWSQKECFLKSKPFS